MFNGDLHDDWRWMPLILIIGALAFLLMDPLGMNNSNVTYVINANANLLPTPIPPPPVIPPGQNPPPGAPPILGYPTYETTGPKTVPATPYTGPAVLNQNDATYDGYIFSQCVSIVGDNITIRNSRFIASCNGSPILTHLEGANLQIIDSEFIGIKQGTGIPVSAVRCSNCSMQGNRVQGTMYGFEPVTAAQITGNYIGQLGGGLINGNPTQNSAVLVTNGDGIVIQGNTIYNDCGVSRTDSGGQGGCGPAIFYQTTCAGCVVAASSVEGNYFRKWNGPAGSVLTTVQSTGATGVKVNTNVFGDVMPAYCTIAGGGVISEWTGNKREDGTDAAKNC